MILTEVFMDWRAASKPYEWHRTIWRLFPDHPKESRAAFDELRDGFLFRIEKVETGNGAWALMLSANNPKDQAEGIQVRRRTENFVPQFKPSESLHFKLTANPVKTIVDEGGRKNTKGETKKCRVPLIREEERLAWIKRKLAGAAEVVQAEIRQEHPIYFRKTKVGKIVPVTFEGTIRVLDGDALRAHMLKGIGPAKAFGCGLLLIRRI